MPYGKAVAYEYPDEQPRVMRDFPRLLSLIRNFTLLLINQRPIFEMRGRDNVIRKTLVAFEQDFNYAYSIFAGIYTTTKEGVSKQLIDFFENVVKPCVDEAKEKGKEEIKYKAMRKKYYEVNKKLIGHSTIRDKFVVKLEDMGWLQSRTNPDDARGVLFSIPAEKLVDTAEFGLPYFKDLFSENDLSEYLDTIQKKIRGESGVIREKNKKSITLMKNAFFLYSSRISRGTIFDTKVSNEETPFTDKNLEETTSGKQRYLEPSSQKHKGIEEAILSKLPCDIYSLSEYVVDELGYSTEKLEQALDKMEYESGCINVRDGVYKRKEE